VYKIAIRSSTLVAGAEGSPVGFAFGGGQLHAADEDEVQGQLDQVAMRSPLSSHCSDAFDRIDFTFSAHGRLTVSTGGGASRRLDVLDLSALSIRNGCVVQAPASFEAAAVDLFTPAVVRHTRALPWLWCSNGCNRLRRCG